MKTKIKSLANKHKNFVSYSIIGVSGVILDFLAFLLLFNVFHVDAVIATSISVFLGITSNFILNAYLNFKKTDRILLRYLSFVSVGLSGLLISIYILALGKVFTFDPNLMKLASIPIIVIYQYLLNKAISFGEIGHKTTLRGLARSFFSKNWGLVIINIIFIISALFFVKSIPLALESAWMNTAPDEGGHYAYNTQFMLKNHRLPVSGKDDVSAYESCRENKYGIVPCVYSYVVFPGANYVFAATNAVAINSLTGVSYEKGARLASVLWGIVFLNFLYLIAVRLTKNRRVGWAVASMALIPQVIFTSSYLNQDAHSLAISAVAIYALIRLLQDKTTISIIIASFAFGALLPLAKYNYFVLIPFIALTLGVFTIKRTIKLSLLLRVVGGAVLAFLIFSSFWFIRNYFLYHDFFGQDFVISEMSKYAPLGHEQPLTLHTLQTYAQMNFFEILFKSFFLTFGSMVHFMQLDRYVIIHTGLLALLGGYLYIIYKTKEIHAKIHLSIVLAVFLALLLSLIALVFYNSIKYDFQPQGRYLYPVLAPLAACLGWAYYKNRNTKYILLGIVFIVGFCLFNAIDIVMRNYLYT